MYRQSPEDQHSLVKHFGAVVKTGPVEPRSDMPKQTTRDFRYPEDLDVFFHSSCAPAIKLSESMEKELARLLADAIIAAYEKTLARWARLRPREPGHVRGKASTQDS